VNWNLQATNTPLKAVRFLRFVWKWLNKDPETDMGVEAANLFGKAEFFPSLLPLLGIGRDVSDGSMELRDGKLNIDWQSKESYPYFLEIRNTMRSLAGKLEAHLWDIPFWWLSRWLSRYITVHPLGGCPMGRNDTEGVVNSYGKVFNYDRLYVADGSVMPGPVGSNPALTIAALADRFADGVIDECKEEDA
jgi:cholesterol oxidase